MDNYPLGADQDPRAPWKQTDPEKIKVKVCISVTYSKELEIEVEEGYSEIDLREAVREAGILPNDLLEKEHTRLRKFIKNREKTTDPEYKKYLKKLIARRDKCKPWHEDELEVIDNSNPSHQIFWQ